MKHKIVFIILLILYASVSHAGLATVIAKEFVKNSESAAKNVLDSPYTGANAARALRPALRTIKIRESVEYKVISYIYDDRDMCNSHDIQMYMSFTKSTTHKDSPARDVMLDSTYIERYKLMCEIIGIKFLGHGESVDEVSRYAYAEVSSVITVAGLMKMTSKSMYVLKLESDTWKFWDATFLSADVELLNESWWLYNPIKRQCFSTDNKTDDYVIRPIILLEDSENMDCSTNGIKDKILTVSCKGRKDDSRSYYAYSPNKKTCEEFGEKVMNVHGVSR